MHVLVHEKLTLSRRTSSLKGNGRSPGASLSIIGLQVKTVYSALKGE